MLPPTRTAARARLAVIAASLALLAMLAVGPALGPAGVRALGPLPACRYDDILTTPRRYVDWQTTLVDTILRVPEGYVPPDLVAASEAGIPGGGKVRAVMIDDLRVLTRAAAKAGNAIGIQSAYRSYAAQEQLFESWVEEFGYDEALAVPARPGHSEHQLGLGIDFQAEPHDAPGATPWSTTPAAKWMSAHAWEYGFVMSYPKGAVAVTCYDDEPWHYRYMGRELAAAIHGSGLTPREYLWAHFTTAIVPTSSTGAPGGTPLPVGSAVPSPTASPLPVPTSPPTPAPSPASVPPTFPPSSAPLAPPAAPAREPVVLAGLGIGFVIAVAAGALVMRRRGRSGVGL